MKILVIGNSDIICMSNRFHKVFKGHEFTIEMFFRIWEMSSTIDENLILSSVFPENFDFVTEAQRPRDVTDPLNVSFDLKTFDAIFIISVGMPPPRNDIFEKSKKLGELEHPLNKIAFDHWTDTQYNPDLIKLSVADGIKFIQNDLINTPIVNLVYQLQYSLNGKIPVILQPVSLPSDKVRYDPEWILNKWYGMDNGPKFFSEYNHAQFKALQNIADDTGSILISYPKIGSDDLDFVYGKYCCEGYLFRYQGIYGKILLNHLREQLINMVSVAKW